MGEFGESGQPAGGQTRVYPLAGFTSITNSQSLSRMPSTTRSEPEKPMSRPTAAEHSATPRPATKRVEAVARTTPGDYGIGMLHSAGGGKCGKGHREIGPKSQRKIGLSVEIDSHLAPAKI